MKKELEELIPKFSGCTDMFNETYKRILENQLEMNKKENEKQENLMNSIKTATEDFAFSIMSLIDDTLATASEKKGRIESVEKYKNLGSINPEAVYGTELSFYCINDEELSIVLNYSKESDDTHIWGGCVDTSKIDWEYLNDILSPRNISVQESNDKLDLGEYTSIYPRFLTITLKRVKKLGSDEESILARQKKDEK